MDLVGSRTLAFTHHYIFYVNRRSKAEAGLRVIDLILYPDDGPEAIVSVVASVFLYHGQMEPIGTVGRLEVARFAWTIADSVSC